MKKFMNWLENSFAPKMNVINHNVWIVTLKDSIMQTLPFIFLGSLFCMLTIPGDVFHIAGWPNFWTPFGWTMGMVSIMVAFLIPFNLMEKKRIRKQRIIAGLSGLVLFGIILTPQLVIDGAIGFDHSGFGAGGMFVAMFSGVIVGVIMQAFGKFSFFSEESVIPDFVRSWFDSMLPIGIVVVLGWVAVDIFGLDVYNLVLSVFMPLGSIIESPWGFSLLMFVYCFLYSMGISSWVMTPVSQPILLAAIAQNVAGTGANLVTSSTIYSAYLWVGGIGCTLPLVFMMMGSRVPKLKALGRASLTPGIFNINEPIVFGAIAWNPVMMVAMWIQGLVLPAVVWLFTKVIAFAPIPMIQFEMWYAPFPFSTWVTSGGAITGIILLAVIVGLASLIWLPFFKAYERQELLAMEKDGPAKKKEAAQLIKEN